MSAELDTAKDLRAGWPTSRPEEVGLCSERLERIAQHLEARYIAPGKIANFTVLAEDPRLVEPTDLDTIPVLGTVFEGRWFPVERGAAAAPARSAPVDGPGATGRSAGRLHGRDGGCSCRAAREVAAALCTLLDAV